MFVLKSLGRMILGNTDQKELLSLPHGSFWRVEIDPKTKVIKSRVEYFNSKDASLVLARGDEGAYSYRLIARATDEAVDSSALSSSSISSIAESRPFRLSAPLSFTKSKKSDTGSVFFYWNEPTEPQVFWEYVPLAPETSATTIEMFQMTIAQCVYETERKKSHQTATDSELQKYLLNDLDEDDGRAKGTGTSGSGESKSSAEFKVAEELVVFKSEQAGFYVFDSASSLFVQKDTGLVRAVISRDAKKPFEYWLHVIGEQERVCHRQRLDSDATQHLDRPSFSFIWCHFTENAYIWTYSLKFPETTAVLAFANAYNQAIYETLNHEKWSKLDRDDAAFLLDPMMDVDMAHETDAPRETELTGRASNSDSDSDSEPSEDESPEATVRLSSKTSADKNQMLAIGYKTDRSFVTRGSNVGVFKHQADDQLGFVAELKVQDLAGRSFSPATKMMLHQEDQSLLLMNPNDQHRIYRMDLNRGAVVDEWTIHDEAKITAMVPDSKYAQMTGQATFIGMNANSIFRVDPRLAGTKRVDSEMKSYVVKNKFSCAATTGAGELAVASEKGEIRLFNKLDKRAKTLLPMFGDAIIGIDVTESGKYILATCKTYLLLINTEIEGEQQALGFSKPMGSKKPLPKRLQLKPEHIAYMGAVPSFTPARFSTGQSEERAIITSTGPFVITWNLRRVKQGHLYEYQIKRYEDKVVADNFRFGQDRSIVVTLPEHVTLISKKSLAAPSPGALRRGRGIVEEYP